MPSEQAIKTFFDVSSEDNVATEAGAQNFLASKLGIDQRKPEGQKLYFETKGGKRIGIGSFITPTIAEMEEMLRKESNEINWSSYQNNTNGASLGNALDMHHTCKDAIVMGAASQPNCLEMGSPLVKPSDGIDGYIGDPTQGPACALSTTMNLLFRQYLLPVEASTGLMSNQYVNENGLLNEEKFFSEFQEWIQNKNDAAIDKQKFGQHDDRQLNCLKPFQKKLIELGLRPRDGSEEFFIYNNGYTFPKNISQTEEGTIISELNRINDFLDPTTNEERTDIQKDELRESLINSFAVGITTDAKFACGYDEDTLKIHDINDRIDDKKVIDQVWVSAFPIGYDSPNKINQIYNIEDSVHGKKAWEPLARLALVAAAKAQLIQGARLNARLIKEGKITQGDDLKPTYLTKVGGGVFKNPHEWIANSIVEATLSLKKKFSQVSFAAELSHYHNPRNDHYGEIDEQNEYPEAHNALIAAREPVLPEQEASASSASASENTSPAYLIDRNKWIADRLNLSDERERVINPAEILRGKSLTQNLTHDDRTEIDNFLRLAINSPGSNAENSTFDLGYFYERNPVPDNLVYQAISDYRDRLNTDFKEGLRQRSLDSMFDRKYEDVNTAKYKLKNSQIEIDCDYYYDRQDDFAQPLTGLSKTKPFVGCGEIVNNTSDEIVRGFVSSIVEGWFDRDEPKPMSAEDLYTQEKKAYLILNESAHWLSIEIAFNKDVRGAGVVEVNYSNPLGVQQSGCSKNVETFIKKVVGFLQLVVDEGVNAHVSSMLEFSSYKETVGGYVNDATRIVLEAQNVTIQEKHLLEQGTKYGCGPTAKANLALLMGDKVRIGRVEISREDFARGASIGERGLMLLPEDDLRLRLQDRYEIFQADDNLTDDRCGVSGVDFGSFKDLQVIQDYIASIDEEQVSRAEGEGELGGGSMDKGVGGLNFRLDDVYHLLQVDLERDSNVDRLAISTRISEIDSALSGEFNSNTSSSRSNSSSSSTARFPDDVLEICNDFLHEKLDGSTATQEGENLRKSAIGALQEVKQALELKVSLLGKLEQGGVDPDLQEIYELVITEVVDKSSLEGISESCSKIISSRATRDTSDFGEWSKELIQNVPLLEDIVRKFDYPATSSAKSDSSGVVLETFLSEENLKEIYNKNLRNNGKTDPENWARLKSVLLNNTGKAKTFFDIIEEAQQVPFDSAEILNKFENEDRKATKKSLTEEFNKIEVLRGVGSGQSVKMENWLNEEQNKNLKSNIDNIPNARDAANKAIKEEEEKIKVFSGTLDKDHNYERFVGKDFQYCDMKNLFRATFLKCTFEEGCKLPTDLSSLEPKYFSQCKIHASLFDGEVGESFKKKFEEEFQLVKSGDFYFTPKNERKYVPKNSPKNPTASNLKDQNQGLGGGFKS